MAGRILPGFWQLLRGLPLAGPGLVPLFGAIEEGLGDAALRFHGELVEVDLVILRVPAPADRAVVLSLVLTLHGQGCGLEDLTRKRRDVSEMRNVAQPRGLDLPGAFLLVPVAVLSRVFLHGGLAQSAGRSVRIVRVQGATAPGNLIDAHPVHGTGLGRLAPLIEESLVLHRRDALHQDDLGGVGGVLRRELQVHRRSPGRSVGEPLHGRVALGFPGAAGRLHGIAVTNRADDVLGQLGFYAGDRLLHPLNGPRARPAGRRRLPDVHGRRRNHAPGRWSRRGFGLRHALNGGLDVRSRRANRQGRPSGRGGQGGLDDMGSGRTGRQRPLGLPGLHRAPHRRLDVRRQRPRGRLGAGTRLDRLHALGGKSFSAYPTPRRRARPRSLRPPNPFVPNPKPVDSRSNPAPAESRLTGPRSESMDLKAELTGFEVGIDPTQAEAQRFRIRNDRPEPGIQWLRDRNRPMRGPDRRRRDSQPSFHFSIQPTRALSHRAKILCRPVGTREEAQREKARPLSRSVGLCLRRGPYRPDCRTWTGRARLPRLPRTTLAQWPG